MAKVTSPWKSYLVDFLAFGLKEAASCSFAGLFFVTLFLSHKIPLGSFPRYDFLFLVAVSLQLVLVLTKLETWDELKAICIFHVLGLALEIFKTHPSIGSWTYPEPGYLKVMGVPLYSGFMYAAVASYMIQAWRFFKLKVDHYPNRFLALSVAIGIYLNFFTHHFWYDLRLPLIFLTFLIFRSTDVSFTPYKRRYRMPLLLSFILIGFFIWLAENIATFYGAWKYPNQLGAWSKVHIGKWNSWSLLAIMTFVIVTNLKHIKNTISHSSLRKYFIMDDQADFVT
ncbi:MAG: DUF817 domain-containing protein [Bdellovibrionales bacterium]|nr:DUF817 domain-containing protein [Bdellovibrionales bacterium]